MQHMLRSVTSRTKCASIHPLISSLQHSDGEEPGLSQGHRALHHCGMMGSFCPCQPAGQELPGFAWPALPWLKGGRKAPAPPCRSVTGTKWCLPSGVLTCEQAESQDASEPIWRMGRQLSSVSGPADLQDHLSLHTHSHLAGDVV